MAKVWGNEEEVQVPQEPERQMGQDGILTDEDLMELQKDAEENQEEYLEYQMNKMKETLATRELLSKRRNQLHEIKIPISLDEVLVFKAKRMSERDRARLNKINFAQFGGDWSKLSQEQLDEISNQAYEVMSEMVVDPKMTVDEWKEFADVALLNELSTTVSKLSTEVSDSFLIEDFKKKLIILLKSNSNTLPAKS